MKFLCYLFASLLTSPLAFSQGGSISSGGILVLSPLGRPIGGATVTVCAFGATGLPCSPTITVYTDPTLVTPAFNPGTTDGNGNLFVYAAPGSYTVTVTGTGITGKAFTATVSGSGGGNVSNGGPASFSTLAVSGTATLNGAMNANAGGVLAGTFSGNPTLTGFLKGTGGSNLSDIIQNSAATHFGDSITQCVGLGSGPNAPTVSTQCYWSILDTAKVWASTNSGITGSGITDVGQMDSILGTTVAATSVSTELCCVNDMRNNGAGGIVGGAQQIDWASSLEAALLWLAVPDANKIKASGASVTYGGSWTTSPQSYGGLTRQTTTAANTASFSVYGTSVYVVSLWQVGNTSTYTVTIDGAVQPTISTVTGSYTTIQGRAFGPFVSRFSGLTETTHSIVLTCTAADASNPCYFVFAAGGSGQAATSGPYVFAGNTLRFTSAGYAGSGGSELIAAQFNLRTQQVVNDLASDGLHVQLVDASGYYTPNGTNTQTDGVHPTVIGHTILATAFQNEMIGYLTPNDRGALRILRNINPCTNMNAGGGGWFIGGCPQNGIANRGDIGAAETATFGRVFLGLDGAGIQRSGANWLFTAPTLTLFQFNGTTSSFPAFKFAGTPAKITVRAADDSGDAAFEALSLSLNGAAALAGQSGTGNICLTTNCGLTTPTFTGVTNGTGLQLFTSSTTCTTGASVGAICTTGAITLPVAYADTNYRLACTGQGPTNVPIVQTYTKSNTTFTITIAALTAAAATFTSYDCSAVHN